MQAAGGARQAAVAGLLEPAPNSGHPENAAS